MIQQCFNYSFIMLHVITSARTLTGPVSLLGETLEGKLKNFSPDSVCNRIPGWQSFLISPVRHEKTYECPSLKSPFEWRQHDKGDFERDNSKKKSTQAFQVLLGSRVLLLSCSIYGCYQGLEEKASRGLLLCCAAAQAGGLAKKVSYLCRDGLNSPGAWKNHPSC